MTTAFQLLLPRQLTVDVLFRGAVGEVASKRNNCRLEGQSIANWSNNTWWKVGDILTIEGLTIEGCCKQFISHLVLKTIQNHMGSSWSNGVFCFFKFHLRNEGWILWISKFLCSLFSFSFPHNFCYGTILLCRLPKSFSVCLYSFVLQYFHPVQSSLISSTCP